MSIITVPLELADLTAFDQWLLSLLVCFLKILKVLTKGQASITLVSYKMFGELELCYLRVNLHSNH